MSYCAPGCDCPACLDSRAKLREAWNATEPAGIVQTAAKGVTLSDEQLKFAYLLLPAGPVQRVSSGRDYDKQRRKALKRALMDKHGWTLAEATAAADHFLGELEQPYRNPDKRRRIGKMGTSEIWIKRYETTERNP